MISQLAASAQSILGDELDAYLLGNVSARVVLIRGTIFDAPLGDQNRNPISTLVMANDRTSPTTQLTTTSV